MDASVSITLMTCPGVPVTNQNVAPVHLRMDRGFLRAEQAIGGCRCARDDPVNDAATVYSTVTLLARFRGRSTSQPRNTAIS